MSSVVESVLPGIARPRGDARLSLAAQLETLWSITRGDPDVRIALLDGPVDRTHPCFEGALLSEVVTLAAGGAKGGPATRHGTHVASIVFGQHGSGVNGVAPACTGLILPVYADGPQDSAVFCSQVDLARAILHAVELGAHVINISGGQLSPDGEPDPLLAKAIQSCADNNVLVVAAAGNDGCECLHVPAAVGTVLPVGACDANGVPLSSSNWGEPYRTRGIIVPGDRIPGAQPGGGVVLRSGTSFAAPFVAGAAALLLSVQRARGEAPNPAAVRHALIAGARPCDPDQIADCRRALAGHLDISRSLSLITEGVTMSEVLAVEPTAQAVFDAPPDRPRAADEHWPASVLSGRAAPTERVVEPSEVAPSTGPAPEIPAARPAIRRQELRRVVPSDCGCGGACGGGSACTCGGGVKSMQLVYALGKLGYDFGTEARRDTFTQAMPGDRPNPHDVAQMVEYLRANPSEAEALIWTLNLDATPIYAIVPAGPFAAAAYDRLVSALAGQVNQGIELVSIPGTIAGSMTLMSGQTVPAVIPSVRGMFAWGMTQLVQQLVGERPRAAAERAAYDRRVGSLNSFLSRVYYDLRNLGVTAQERALNFSATNAFQVAQVMESAAQGDLELDTINIRKSPVCRPDSDCYDVEIGFFDPRNVNVATRIYRFTVDVSDVMPVTIGEVRAWSRRG